MRLMSSLVMLALFSAPAAADDEKKQLDRLQGTWHTAPDPLFGGARTLTIEGNRWIIDGKESGTITVGPGGRKYAITLTYSNGTVVGAGKTILPGIYTFEGGELLIHWGVAGRSGVLGQDNSPGVRPEDFPDRPGDRRPTRYRKGS